MNQRQLVAYRSAIAWFQRYFSYSFTSVVQEAIPTFIQPESLRTLGEQIAQLYNLLHNLAAVDLNQNVDLERVPRDLWPLLKRVLLLWRREKTEECERFKDTTINSEVLDGFDAKIRELDEFLDDPLLQSVEPITMPLLLDY